jgi:hypothetical protein
MSALHLSLSLFTCKLQTTNFSMDQLFAALSSSKREKIASLFLKNLLPFQIIEKQILSQNNFW